MSAIKSLSSEIPINSATESAGMLSKPIQDYSQKNKQAVSLGYQQLTKKIADSLVQKAVLKAGSQPHFFHDTKTQVLAQSPEFFQNITQSKHAISPYLGNAQKGNIASTIQMDKQHEVGRTDQPNDFLTEIDYQPLLLLSDDLLDDEVPLINMNGIPIIPHQEVVQRPSSLLSFSAKVENATSGQPVLTEFIGEVKPLSHGPSFNKTQSENQATSLITMAAKLQSLTVSRPEVMLQAAQPNVEAISGQERLVMVTELGTKENRDKVNTETFTALTSERFIQDSTNIEINPSVLLEMANGDDINMARTSLIPIETGIPAQTHVQAVTVHEPVTVSQKMAEFIEHSAVFQHLEASENMPRTLTYTFNQWKKAPSVTFELATKTEFIATTYSREVEQTLQENKHLLSDEKNIYFRQEQGQERGQQHKQRQESYPQEEE